MEETSIPRRAGGLSVPLVPMVILAAISLMIAVGLIPVATDDASPATVWPPASPIKLPPLSQHALETHPEAPAIHDAGVAHLENKSDALKTGLLQVFKKRGEDRFILLCRIGDPDDWGIEIRTGEGECVTAFRPGDGSLKSVLRYRLEQATRYTGDLPWLN